MNMGIFSRRKAGEPGQDKSVAAPVEQVDPSLSDADWFALSADIYERTWRDHLGSPETFADAGRAHYGNQNFAVAMLFFRKAIDLLHTLYTSSEMSARQPSARDLAITSGFASSLGAALAMHPASPVADSVREVTHRLRTISSACKRAGLPAELYLNALQEIGIAAPGVMVDDIPW
jgi:hypothetical protein